MKYLSQIGIIFLFSLLGELCRFLIPMPIPASIYGMVLLFAALALKILPLHAVRESGSFLSSCLPVLFVAPVVSLLDCWEQLKGSVWAVALILAVTTLVTFGVSGLVTGWMMKKEEKNHA